MPQCLKFEKNPELRHAPLGFHAPTQNLDGNGGVALQESQMVHKESEMFFIAYNLIRCLMGEAASRYHVGIGWLSFKGTVDSVRQFATAIAQARSRKKQNQLLDKLLEVIARDLLPERFGRYEPRAVKRRPKPYSLLNRPRDKFKQVPHRNRYWKNNPRKSKG